MKVLVFGASGQVARSLKSSDHVNCACVLLGRPEGDICDPDAVARAVDDHEPDIVINPAAYTVVDRAETESDLAFAVNRDGARNVAAACDRAGVPLIHFSTDYVFDGAKDGLWHEDDPIAPLGVYGQSKAAGEAAVREALDNHVILRTAWVFSPFGGNFVKTMIRLGAERDSLNVVSDQVGSPSYAPDLAEGALEIGRQIFNGNRAFGVYHLTNSGTASWYEFALEIFRQAKSRIGIDCDVAPIPTRQYPTPAQRPSNSRLSNEKVHKAFHLKLRPWPSALEACIAAIQSR
jgi:dTDP-4-dehydrorhamnose reductase